MRQVLLCVVCLAALVSGAPDEAGSLPVEIQALRDVHVPAEVAGRVLKRIENESAPVRAGEVVVTIDAELLSAAARAAKASASRAKARLEWAQLELRRVLALFEKGSVGEAESQQAQLTAREAEAGLEAAEAQAAEVTARLARAKVVAPFDGRLVRIHPQAGEYIRVGETAFRIIDDSSLKILLYVPAQLLPDVRPGAKLRIESDLFDLKLPALEAKVFSVAPAAEGKSRTFRVEARATDETGRWRPGMTGRLALRG